MDRVLRDTQSEIRVTFYVNGVATDATGTPTVTITRDSGTAVVTDAATTKVSATTGVYKYDLTPTHTATLDLLTARWKATLSGTANQIFTTQAEVVGGFLCTLESITASLPTGTTATTDQLVAARRWAEGWLEDSCGVSFRPRYSRATLSGTGTTDLLLPHPRPLSIVSATLDDEALTVSDIGFDASGTLFLDSYWTAGAQNVEVVYTHGWPDTPSPVSRVATRLARYFLINDPTNLDERATSITTDEASYSLVTPGIRGALFSLPEANMVVEEYGYRVLVT